jgi:hypothetical protein
MRYVEFVVFVFVHVDMRSWCIDRSCVSLHIVESNTTTGHLEQAFELCRAMFVGLKGGWGGEWVEETPPTIAVFLPNKNHQKLVNYSRIFAFSRRFWNLTAAKSEGWVHFLQIFFLLSLLLPSFCKG